jgi:thymidylate synthase (FAD)
MSIINKIKVLDHGYIGLVEHWGSDEGIIEAARMSTDKGFQGWGPTTECNVCRKPSEFIDKANYQDICDNPDCAGFYTLTRPGDEKLLAYLYRNKHATPFEMAGMTIEIQAPIFVFREWHRHRTQSYNELSARYTPIPNLNYIPSIDRLMLNNNGTNKQAGTIAEAAKLTRDQAVEFRNHLGYLYANAEREYQNALHDGIPKELARICLPVGRYSRMRASANLRNWLGFLTLRMDPAAQWEIRQYAQEVFIMIQDKFPRTAQLFLEGIRK